MCQYKKNESPDAFEEHLNVKQEKFQMVEDYSFERVIPKNLPVIVDLTDQRFSTIPPFCKTQKVAFSDYIIALFCCNLIPQKNYSPSLQQISYQPSSNYCKPVYLEHLFSISDEIDFETNFPALSKHLSGT